MSRAGPDIITSETRASLLQTSVFGGKKNLRKQSAQTFQNGKSEVPRSSYKDRVMFFLVVKKFFLGMILFFLHLLFVCF